MMVLNFAAGAKTDGTAIEINQELNTNNKIELSENSVLIKTPGVYEIIGEICITNSGAVNTGVYVHANGQPHDIASAYTAGSTSANALIPLYTVIKVDPSSSDDYVDITFMPVGNPTIVDGYVSIKEIV